MAMAKLSPEVIVVGELLIPVDTVEELPRPLSPSEATTAFPVKRPRSGGPASAPGSAVGLDQVVHWVKGGSER